MKIGPVKSWLLAAFVSLACFVSPALAGAAHGVAREAAATESFVDVWGPAVGSALPVLDAVDHSGERRRLADLAGRRGLLLFLVRSADW